MPLLLRSSGGMAHVFMFSCAPPDAEKTGGRNNRIWMRQPPLVRALAASVEPLDWGKSFHDNIGSGAVAALRKAQAQRGTAAAQLPSPVLLKSDKEPGRGTPPAYLTLL
jgi:hypothetical protein